LLWLKAFGVQAIAVPGKNSPETWHPFQRPDKFDGLLEPIWRRFDTTIYKVPIRSLSLAHVVRWILLCESVPSAAMKPRASLVS
jgi:hypothetical protein